MSRLRQVKDIYDSIMNTVTSNEVEWKEWWTISHKLRYSARN